MRVKTSELTGIALDYIVSLIEGIGFYRTTDPDRYDSQTGFTHNFNPSVDWAQGGPIIEREQISIGKADDPDWWAFLGWKAKNGSPGLTPLIAAMRCYVVSKLGDEVDIPNELL